MLEPRRLFAGVAGCAACLCLVACGAVQSAQTNGPHTAATERASAQAHQAVLNGIMPKLTSSELLGASITAPPTDAQSGASRSWLSVLINDPYASTHGMANLEARWEAALAAGALKDESITDGLSPMGGYSVEFYANGAENLLTSSSIDSAATLTPSSRAYSANQLVHRIYANAAKNGVTVESVSFVYPDGPAAIVRLSVKHASAVVGSLNLSDIVGSLKDYDGVFLTVDDKAGVAIADWYATRLDQSYVWVRSDLDGGGDYIPPGKISRN